MKQKSNQRVLDPSGVLSAFHTDAEKIELIQKVLDSKIPCYAFGRNEHVKNLSNFLQLEGVVDDYAGGTSWNDLTVISGEAVPAGAMVVNCSMAISPLSAEKRISTLPQVMALNYADLLRLADSELAVPQFVAAARVDLTSNLSRHRTVFESLTDEESKQVFNRVMSYRLTADPSFMRGFSVRFKEQYFEGFLGVPDDSIFVDCGGFDGDTTEIFASRHPNYANIYFFEPSIANMLKARDRLASLRNIEFVPLGVSNKREILRFDSASGSASAISMAGDSSIDVTTLDGHIDERTDFIKMDLEGWELNALQGAERHIREHQPILAIAVYHHISDFWKIPEYVLSQHADYDIYLRHYTEGWSETVMYFVPRRIICDR